MVRDIPSASTETTWTPPAEFDGFRVVRLLGRGGMGEVYLGHDTTLERPVALKFIATNDPALAGRERFLIEARAIARLTHPNVVGIFRIGEVYGRPYLAYEFIPGTSLDRLVKPIAWQKALEIGLGVARGLAAAHKRDVLHRDIKPANVIVTDAGEVKLLDFGIAKLLDQQAPGGSVAPGAPSAPPLADPALLRAASGDPETIAMASSDEETIALGSRVGSLAYGAPGSAPPPEAPTVARAAPIAPEAQTIARGGMGPPSRPPAIEAPPAGAAADQDPPTVARPVAPPSGAPEAETIARAFEPMQTDRPGAPPSWDPADAAWGAAIAGPPATAGWSDALEAPSVEADLGAVIAGAALPPGAGAVAGAHPSGSAWDEGPGSMIPTHQMVRAVAPSGSSSSGGSYVSGSSSGSSSGAGVQLTAFGALLGTPIYMAPELWRGLPATPQSDIYALGLILHELVTGHLPHEGLRGSDLAEAVLNRGIPRLGPMCPGIPQSFADIVDRCVRRKAKDRYATADEVVEALELVRTVYQPFASEGGASRVDEGPIRVAASFARIAPSADAFSLRFYDRLFELYPSVRPLFPENMTEQRQKLVGALQVVVENLHRPERLVPLLEELGKKHAPFGVVPEHFDAVGQVLIETLAGFDAGAWNEALEGAWGGAYAIVAEAMQRGLNHELTTGGRAHWTGSQAAHDAPRTRYTSSGDVTVAYQVFGAGSIPGGRDEALAARPIDVLLASDWITHLEVGWQCPQLARFLRRLGRLARVAIFDKRGIGLSDKVTERPTLDDRVADLRAVMDAAGFERAVLFGVGDAVAHCAAFGAAHPDRTRGLVLFGGAARALRAPDYPDGLDPVDMADLFRRAREAWGEPIGVEIHAPSLASDEAFRRWWATYLRMASGPGPAFALLRATMELDVRDVLPGVVAPALVLHREADAVVPAALGRYLAERIPGARYVELSGADHVPYAGDADAVLEEVRRFLAFLSEEPDASDQPAG